MDILKVTNLSKSFSSQKIIDNLSFKVGEKTIYGFIGENGAGKTTTMKMILGLLKSDDGIIEINGEKVIYGDTKTNKYIGYLPDVPEFYGYMTAYEYLNLCGEITGIPKEERMVRIVRLLEMVGLENYKKRISGFSRGMKQRLGIAQGLLNKPKLLICDEPTSALDPIGRKEILDILKLVKEETTVIFSTHILSDVENICDEIGLLHNGKLALQGSLEEIKTLRKSEGFNIEFKSLEDAERFSKILPIECSNNKPILEYIEKSEEDMGYAMKLLYENKIHPLKIEMREPTLESLFMEVVSK